MPHLACLYAISVFKGPLLYYLAVAEGENSSSQKLMAVKRLLFYIHLLARLKALLSAPNYVPSN